MINTIEILQDVLLIFTVIILVYVLYKRLLKILGKDRLEKHYPVIGEKVMWKDPSNAILEVTLPEKTKLNVGVYSNHGERVLTPSDKEYEVGKNLIEVNCAGLNAGKYYFKIVSPIQEYSLYFDIK